MNKFIKRAWVLLTSPTTQVLAQGWCDLISLSLHFRLPTRSFSLYIFHCYKNSTHGQIWEINLLLCFGNMALVLIWQAPFRHYSL